MNSKLIENNKEYLIADKPGTILSQKSGADASLQFYLENKFKTKLHIITRLDRPVSGLTLFSKSPAFTSKYEEQQSNQLVTKQYIGIVEGLIELDGIYQANISHDRKAFKAKIHNEAKPFTKKIETSFKTLLQLDRYSVVLASIHAGAFHQIRAHLASLGACVKGDVKYGARRSNKDRSIYLHSYQIGFKNLKDNYCTYRASLPQNDNLWSLVSQHLIKEPLDI